jgi:hypothetical protein
MLLKSQNSIADKRVKQNEVMQVNSWSEVKKIHEKYSQSSMDKSKQFWKDCLFLLTFSIINIIGCFIAILIVSEKFQNITNFDIMGISIIISYAIIFYLLKIKSSLL